MKLPVRALLGALFTIALLAIAPAARAIDLTGGLMYAVPTPGGHAPKIDGKLEDWDMSGQEPIWAANQTAKIMHGYVAAEYDDDALYLAANVTLPNRPLLNVNGPADAFWAGDVLELRVASDPALPFPLDGSTQVAASDRICHMTLWKNTVTGKAYINIAYGTHFDKGHVLNPPGSEIAVSEGNGGYILEARVPWSALNVPGGKNPFAAGQRMTATWSVHWGFDYQIPMLFTSNPGSFAFQRSNTWGQIAFSPDGHLKPHHGTMEEALLASQPKPVGVPVTVDVPDSGKLSVNIFGPNGQVLRELCGGVDVKPGPFTAAWDGRDQWGVPLTPGTYKWGAYLSHGLTPHYMGEVGSSGTPPTQTADGKGGWGGDHGQPIGVASDAGGIYFAWQYAEAESYTVKIDFAGNTLWRKSPFVNSGWTEVNAIAANGKYLFATWDGVHPILSRQDASTGALLPFGAADAPKASVQIPAGTPIAAPHGSLPFTCPDGSEPECLGLAASANEVFASVYSLNKIQVLDPETGAATRTIDCPRPRGLALDSAGDLYAVSYGTDQPAQIVEFKGAAGGPAVVVKSGLVAPFSVAVDAAGDIHVTDGGASQQVKTFSPAGKLIATAGKQGGRPLSGTYDPSSFLNPTAIAADSQGGIDIAQTSIPKVFDRLDAATGKTLKQWFGWPAYGVSNIGDPDDPWTSYYPYEPGGFARAKVPVEGGLGFPTAYWDLTASGIDGVGGLYEANCLPYVQVLANKRRYFISDSNPHGVCLIEGDNMLPVGHLRVKNWYERDNPTHKTYIEMWIDRNGDHKPQPEEMTTVYTIQEKPLPGLSGSVGSTWMDDRGDVYISSWNNRVIKIPSDGFEKSGAIDWNLDKMDYAVEAVLPSMVDGFASGGRSGMGGIRVDSKGNMFTCLSVDVPGMTPALADKIKAAYPDIPQSQWAAWATPALAKQMHEGLGHTAESTAVKFAKYDSSGKIAWVAGRKATAAPAPGEMYHFWALAGMVGDDYVVGASEWGPMYFYTSDGFYVDSIMNDPNQLAQPGPYTFGSETFGGRVQAYPKLGQVWAYNQGGLYRVDGFDSKLRVEGERRMYGEVALDKIYGAETATATIAPLTLSRLNAPLTNPKAWDNVAESDIVRGGSPLAQVKLGYDDSFIYARYHVNDSTPLVNAADDIRLAFKGGDAVALDLGPAGSRQAPALGDVRILAAQIGGKPRLIAMKPFTNLSKAPQDYFTPAGGTKHFEFVGEIPGGQAVLTADSDGQGYTAIMAIPRSFVELSLAPGMPLKGDVEVLLSGQGSRGMQTITRNPLFASGHSETTMADDTPTESWLYPQYWGDASLR
jgi:hypothetical protein